MPLVTLEMVRRHSGLFCIEAALTCSPASPNTASLHRGLYTHLFKGDARQQTAMPAASSTLVLSLTENVPCPCCGGKHPIRLHRRLCRAVHHAASFIAILSYGLCLWVEEASPTHSQSAPFFSSPASDLVPWLQHHMFACHNPKQLLLL